MSTIKQAIEALESCAPGDYSTGHVIHPSYDEEKVNAALAALRSMPEPYAYAVYFPDQPTEELVHDLDELLDDMTNREHTITELFATTPTAPKVVSSNLPVVSKAVLSEAEILEIMREWPVETNVWADHIDFARAIERAVRGEKL